MKRLHNYLRTPQAICYRGTLYPASYGTWDTVYCWATRTELHVLMLNSGLGYAGLDIFPLNGDSCSSIFTQNAEEEIDRKFFDRSPAFQRRLLDNYIY
jgi:hypothetical protein